MVPFLRGAYEYVSLTGGVNLLVAFIQKEDLDQKISTHFHPHRIVQKQKSEKAATWKKKYMFKHLKYRGHLKKIFLPWYIEESVTSGKKRPTRICISSSRKNPRNKNHDGFRRQKGRKKDTCCRATV